MHIFSVFTWPYQFCSRYWIFLVVIKPGLHPVWNQVPQSRCSWPKVNIPILFFLQTASLCYWTLSERWYCNPSVYYLSNTVINYRVSVTLTINIQWHPNSCLFFIHSSYLCCQMTSWYFSWISYEKFNLRKSKNKMLFFFLWILLCVSCIESWCHSYSYTPQVEFGDYRVLSFIFVCLASSSLLNAIFFISKIAFYISCLNYRWLFWQTWVIIAELCFGLFLHYHQAQFSGFLFCFVFALGL